MFFASFLTLQKGRPAWQGQQENWKTGKLMLGLAIVK